MLKFSSVRESISISSVCNHCTSIVFGTDEGCVTKNPFESDPEDLPDNPLSHPQIDVAGTGAHFEVRFLLFNSIHTQKLHLIHKSSILGECETCKRAIC